MTKEEYEDRRRRIEANIADARLTLNRARYNFERLCGESAALRREWVEQEGHR